MLRFRGVDRILRVPFGVDPLFLAVGPGAAAPAAPAFAPAGLHRIAVEERRDGEVVRFTGGADATDGLEVTSAPPRPEFPDGRLVAMNSASRNSLLCRWRDVAALLSSKPTSH
jgi:hypothetical protein